VSVIWLVWESDGEYSDRTETAACWYPTQAEAQAEADRLTAAQGTGDWGKTRYCAVFVERGKPVKP